MTKASAIFVGLLLIALWTPLGFPPAYTNASSEQPNPPLSLGFGPTSLISLQEGVPVYTLGDEIWAFWEGEGEALISLLTPARPEGSPPSIASAKWVEPRTPARLYVIPAEAQGGAWRLIIEDQAKAHYSVVIPIIVQDGGETLAELAAMRLEGKFLKVEVELKGLERTYDLEHCVANETSGGIWLELPPSLGQGLLIVSPEAGRASLLGEGIASEPFTFWLEARHPYSLTDASGRLIARVLMVFWASTALLQGQGLYGLKLKWEAKARAGRYAIRAFFAVGQEIIVKEFRAFRLVDGSWLPTPSCSPNPLRNYPIELSIDLEGPSVNWPSKLYIFYRWKGVEGQSAASLHLPVSKASFVAMPWGKLLEEGYDLTIKRAPPSVQASFHKGMLFCLGGPFPMTISYALKFGEKVIAEGDVTFQKARAEQAIPVQLSKLMVKVRPAWLQERKEVPLVSVSGWGASITKEAKEHGAATFYLPPGSYRVEASVGEIRVVKEVLLRAMEETLTEFELGGAGGIGAIELVFAALLALGAALNMFVWSKALKLRRLLKG